MHQYRSELGKTLLTMWGETRPKDLKDRLTGYYFNLCAPSSQYVNRSIIETLHQWTHRQKSKLPCLIVQDLERSPACNVKFMRQM